MSAMQQRSIKVDGYVTSYLDAGPEDGVPVVLLHDGAWGGSNLVSWSGVIGHLGRGYRVLAPDLLGFGRSSKAIHFDSSPYAFRIDHLLSFLDLLALERPVHLVGTSFGGSVALNLLAEHSHRAASVMSISGTGVPWRSAFGRKILGSWDGTKSGIRDILAVLAEPSAEFDLEEQVSDRFATASLPGHYRAMTAPGVDLPPILRPANMAAMMWPQQLAGTNVPVTLVHGSRDALVEPEWTQHLKSVLSNCSVVVHDGLHAPNLDRPSYIASLISQCVGSSDIADIEREDCVA